MPSPYQYRDENGDLRLDELLGARDSAHYVRILSSSSEEFSAMQMAMALEEFSAGTGTVYAEREDAWDDGGYVLRRGHGLPSQASSCRDLEPVPSWCWDVCGYYRRLGVGWKATVKELRLAYLARDPRQEDRALHYALTQLLDPELRRAYDRVPLGGLFMADRDVQAAFRRAAGRESARRMAAAPDEESSAREQVLREWGFQDGVPDEEARARVLSPDGPGLRITPSWKAKWGYYVIVVSGHDERLLPSGEEMEAWQAMIAAELERRGIRAAFAVGASAGETEMALRHGNESCIFVLTTGKASEAGAAQAVRQAVSRNLIRHRRHKRN